jgi:ribosomal protein S18 acetylase RimI-like enzyme
MNIAIRPARTDDGPRMYRAWEAVRAHNASRDSRVRYVPVTEAEFMAGLHEVIQRPQSIALVAENGSELLGFVSAGIEQNQPDRLPERHATIGYFYVVPGHRRAGIGRKLFDAVCRWAAEQEGVSHVEMTVLEGDKDASAFWRSVGFSPFIQRLWAPLPEATDA